MKTFNKNIQTIISEHNNIILNELFDYTPEDIQKAVIDKDNNLNIEYSFHINKKLYQVDFIINKQTKSVKFSFALLEREDENEEVHPLGITRTGDSALVFGAVANIFKQFISEYSSRFDKVVFLGSKKDISRIKLYDRFSRNSWLNSIFDVDIRDDNDVKYYTLIKKSHDDINNI